MRKPFRRLALLTTIQVADLLQVRPQTVRSWRSRGRGPAIPFIKIGATIRYRRADVERFLSRSTRRAKGRRGRV